ncbi:MAG: chemotaxis protein CheA [Alkaliphilus sp.]
MDMNQYLDIFIEESKEHLQIMNQILLQLENNHGDINMINEIFRVAHTIKGMAGTMGYTHTAHLTHEMENALQLVRSGEIKISSAIIDVLFQCFDKLEKYVDEVERDGNEGSDDSVELIELIKKTIQKKDSEETTEEDTSVSIKTAKIKVGSHVENAVRRAWEKEYNTFLIEVELNKKCMLKAARAYIVINELESISEIIYSNPSIEDIEDEKFELEFQFIAVSKADEKVIGKKLRNIMEIENISVTDLRENDVLELDSSIINSVDFEEDNDYSTVKTLDKKTNDTKNNEVNQERDAKKPKTGKTVRVDIERLDNLMNLVSELIIIKTRLEDIDSDGTNTNMHEATEYLERITTSLHDAVMKVRMVPVERVFNRFPRMVRDLSKELGKDIILKMRGQETELDRTVIDEIGEPLIHLIRNSIDHGIELPSAREKLGKTQEAIVELIAYSDGNSVVIEVTDDGAGIDAEAIKKIAIERGAITSESAETMSDEELIRLLFDAGFSTAKVVSDLSGRGVGLDVVRTKIESLGGNIEINTVLGQGSKFVIRLPLTLAIIQALLVKTSNEKYAIPLNSIKEITSIEESRIREIQGNEVVLYRNETLPIKRIVEMFNVEYEVNESTKQDEKIVVIVKKGDKTVGIVVDDLIGQQEVVIKSLGKYLASVKAIAGATILGNGSIALIVDTNSFF